MGFHATETEVDRPQIAPDRTATPLKNRVWNFSATSRNRAGFSTSQPVDLHQESSDTSTITVSGLSFWLSRDPIGETGARLSSGFAAQKKAVKAKERLQKLRKISERDAIVATAVARLIAKLEQEIMRTSGDYPMTVLVQGNKSLSSPELIFNDYNFCLNRPTDAIDVLGLKVTNNGKCSVIVKPESGGFGNAGNPPVLLDPGETYDLPQDGVISCCPDDDCPIYKTVDGVDVTLSGNGGWSGGNGVSDTGGFGQWCKGGCKKVGFTTDGAWGTQDQINNMCLNAVILP